MSADAVARIGIISKALTAACAASPGLFESRADSSISMSMDTFPATIARWIPSRSHAEKTRAQIAQRMKHAAISQGSFKFRQVAETKHSSLVSIARASVKARTKTTHPLCFGSTAEPRLHTRWPHALLETSSGASQPQAWCLYGCRIGLPMFTVRRNVAAKCVYSLLCLRPDRALLDRGGEAVCPERAARTGSLSAPCAVSQLIINPIAGRCTCALSP